VAKLVHYTTKYPPCHGSQTLKRTSGPRYPPQLSKGSWISEKKKAPTFYLVTIFENKLEVEPKKIDIPVFIEELEKYSKKEIN